MRVFLEIYYSVQFNYGQVIVEVRCMEFRVIVDAQNVHFKVGEGFCVTMNIPFSKSNSKLLWSKKKFIKLLAERKRLMVLHYSWLLGE